MLLRKDPKKRPTVEQILKMPYIRHVISLIVDESVHGDSIAKTILQQVQEYKEEEIPIEFSPSSDNGSTVGSNSFYSVPDYSPNIDDLKA